MLDRVHETTLSAKHKHNETADSSYALDYAVLFRFVASRTSGVVVCRVSAFTFAIPQFSYVLKGQGFFHPPKPWLISEATARQSLSWARAAATWTPSGSP